MTEVTGTPPPPPDPAEEAKMAWNRTFQSLSPAAQQHVLAAAAGLSQPAATVNDAIWLAIVTGFLVVLVAAGFTLAIIFLTTGTLSSNNALLTVFTTVAGYLAGLLTPGPVKSGGSSS